MKNLRLLLISLALLIPFSLATAFDFANVKNKNGFDLRNSTIPVNKILSGGPPRDGIPSIDKPKFITAAQAHATSKLKPKDRVIGLSFNGEARAYPINILNWHEIVNDVVNGKAVSVTYCPLCGTGIVYAADITSKGKIERYQFGVSGLLYNSDVLLYDRQTETLWSQILSKAISGPMVNSTLKMLPSSLTSWKTWKQKHPNTKVLSTNTGFTKDYNRSPYGDYDNNRSLYFQVSAESKKYHPKERVLGISINGKFKSYPFVELARLKQSKQGKKLTLHDSFDGKELVIDFDTENRDAVIKDKAGNIIPSINSFWFAWFAFHPGTDIYTFK